MMIEVATSLLCVTAAVCHMVTRYVEDFKMNDKILLRLSCLATGVVCGLAVGAGQWSMAAVAGALWFVLFILGFVKD